MISFLNLPPATIHNNYRLPSLYCDMYTSSKQQYCATLGPQYHSIEEVHILQHVRTLIPDIKVNVIFLISTSLAFQL